MPPNRRGARSPHAVAGVRRWRPGTASVQVRGTSLAYSPPMARLRRVSPQMKGWTRRRAGKGFAYLDADGGRLPKDDVERIRSLAIPPAWTRRVDLPLAQRPHPGRRHRRGRPPPVPLPPGLAHQARRDEVRPGQGGRHAPRQGARADHRGPPARGDAARPRRRDGHPPARPRLLPDRQRRVCRRQRFVRTDHPRAPPRPATGQATSSSASSASRASSTRSRSATRRSSSRSTSCASVGVGRLACWRTGARRGGPTSTPRP